MSDDGPRLAPLPVEEWTDEARAALPAHLRRPELYLSGPDPLPLPTVLGLFAHHLELAEPWLTFSDTLANEHSRLDPRLRELAVLRVAWRTRSGYEWVQHTRIGRQAGLTTEQLYAVPEGPASGLWTPLERALVAATDQMIDRFGVEDDTWADLEAHLDRAQLLELLFVIGSYLCLALVFNSTGLRPDPPTEPIDAPELPPRP